MIRIVRLHCMDKRFKWIGDVSLILIVVVVVVVVVVVAVS